MVGLVVATHGTLAEGLKNAAHLLAGDAANFSTAELMPGMEPKAFVDELQGVMEESDEGDGVVVLVDLFGGTPSNSVCQLLGHEGWNAVAGVNLPMVLEALFSRSDMDAKSLAEHLALVGSDAAFDIGSRLAESSGQRIDDGEDDEGFE
jgi:mannose/fructose/sorbose-specific phosphotransferase system IIA component